MQMKFKTRTKLVILISSLISIGLVVFIAINANRSIGQMSENNSELYSAYRISELMKSFRTTVAVLESKQQGYLITGDGKFLEAYKEKESEAKTYLHSMEKYFSGKPEEEKFYTLKTLTYKKLMEGKDLGGLQTMGLPANRNTNPDDEGVQTTTEINNAIEEINQSLSETTKMLIDNSVEFVEVSKKWSMMEVIIGIFAGLAAVVILFRDLNIRNRLENELRIAKQKADDNAMMKEQFMANMSHEIRTPMNAILGFSNLLNKTTLDDVQGEYVSAIKTSGSNLLNIINDILDFSKIGAGKMAIEKIPFDLSGLIGSLRLMFSEKAADKNISFTVTVDEAVPKFVFGDPTRLTQILVNLINNAIKFTNEGSVKLSCEVKSIEHDVAQLVFRIKDTGIGIPADKIHNVFDRFNQGNSETNRKYGGTGLGLSIVKNLVEIQNGTLEVKSVENSGSEFIVVMSYPVSYEDLLSSESSTGKQLVIHSDKTLNVLLVEDNVLNQRLASTYLKAFGLEVQIAENGQIALDKLKQQSFDLVLMDIQMPVMDGYTAAQKIRNELKLSVPVIAMTAHIMVDEREKCISYGMNDYISKPFKEEMLFEIVSRHLSKYISEKKNIIAEPELKPILITKETGIVNPTELFSLARGNNEFVKEMIQIFLEQNPSDVKEIEKGIATKDYGTIRSMAHNMATSVGFMGMAKLLEPLAQIERLAKSEKGLAEIEQLFAIMKTGFNTAIQELSTILEKIDQDKEKS